MSYPTIRKRIIIFFYSPSFSSQRKNIFARNIWWQIEFFYSEFLGRDISYPNKKKRSRGEVNIPWRWKILSPNLFVYIECVVSIPRMIRTRIFVSDLGRRYSGVPARACSLYQEIYIYIYIHTNRESITSSFQETEKEIEGSGRGGVHFSNREISRI